MTSNPTTTRTAMQVENMSFYYGGTKKAIEGVFVEIFENKVTALIGPSGCGKSTFIKALNRIHELEGPCKVDGRVTFFNQDIYAPQVNLNQLRRQIGMVFQRPNPFPKSIYDNVAYGLRLVGGFSNDALTQRVTEALQGAALWDEVKDRLDKSALGLSGGQQQRLCIARALAVQPKILLMDEPCSALDPIATMRIEELINELREKLTIVIVTHNMQQATRVSDFTAFFTTDESRIGRLVEFDRTERLFSQANDARTRDYVAGRFG